MTRIPIHGQMFALSGRLFDNCHLHAIFNGGKVLVLREGTQWRCGETLCAHSTDRVAGDLADIAITFDALRRTRVYGYALNFEIRFMVA